MATRPTRSALAGASSTPDSSPRAVRRRSSARPARGAGRAPGASPFMRRIVAPGTPGARTQKKPAPGKPVAGFCSLPHVGCRETVNETLCILHAAVQNDTGQSTNDLLARTRSPVQVAQDLPGRIASRQAGDATTRMGARAAQVQAGQRAAVV